MPGKISSVRIMAAATASGTVGTAVEPVTENMTFQAMGTLASGTGAATIDIEGSLDNTNFTDLGTITLTLASGVTVSDGLAVNAPWRYVRANAVGVSGASATPSIDVYMGTKPRGG